MELNPQPQTRTRFTADLPSRHQAVVELLAYLSFNDTVFLLRFKPATALPATHQSWSSPSALQMKGSEQTEPKLSSIQLDACEY